MPMMTKSRLKQKKQNLNKLVIVDEKNITLIKATIVLKSKILPNSVFLFVPKRSYLQDTILRNNKIQPLTNRY